MDAKIRQLLREFQTTQDPVIAMQIASALCRVADTTTKLLAVGEVDDEGSGTILISTEVDISPELHSFEIQLVANQLYEERGNLVPDQILIVGYGDTSPEVIFHGSIGRDFQRPGIDAMLFVLRSLKVETQLGRDNEGQLLIDTSLRAGTKKAKVVVPIFERVFPNTAIGVDNDRRIVIYTGINEADAEDADELLPE